jgi:hypothetical protein
MSRSVIYLVPRGGYISMQNFPSHLIFWVLSVLGLLLASPTRSSAQVPITGGSGQFRDARVFIPSSAQVFANPTGKQDARAVIYGNNDVQSAMIRTQIGDLPANVLFRTTINPVVGNSVNRAIAVGDQTNISGRVSFRIPSTQGGSVFFNQVPATLNATFTSVPTTTTFTATREYISPNYIFTEFGTVSGGNTTAVIERNTPVDVVQYVPGAAPPGDITVANATVPAAAFTEFREGNTQTGDYAFNVTGGTFGDGSTTLFNNGSGQAPVPSVPPASYNHYPTQSTPYWQYTPGVVIYQTQTQVYSPALGRDVEVGVQTGYTAEGRRSNCGCAGEVVLIDRITQIAYTPVGAPSRVFPGMTGMHPIAPPSDQKPPSGQPPAQSPPDPKQPPQAGAQSEGDGTGQTGGKPAPQLPTQPGTEVPDRPTPPTDRKEPPQSL